METPPSTQTLLEMVRSIREEQLPAMHREISQRLDSLTDQVKITNGQVRKHEMFINEHTAQLGLWKWLAGALIAAIGAVTAIFSLYHK